MDPKLTLRDPSTAPLPALLRPALRWQPPGLGKRERTRLQLLRAALQVFFVRGVAGATIQEIAATASMTAATVYNHFATKDAVVQAVAAWLADSVCGGIAASQATVPEGAERMAIGQRRFIGIAEQSPVWALVFLDLAQAAPEQVSAQVARYAGADLRLGIAQGAFKVSDEAAALDLVLGVPTQAMLSIAKRGAPAGHAVRVTAMLLQALGLSPAKAAEVASRPLPPVDADDDAERARAEAGRRAATSPRRATTARTRSARSRAARFWSCGPRRSRASGGRSARPSRRPRPCRRRRRRS